MESTIIGPPPSATSTKLDIIRHTSTIFDLKLDIFRHFSTQNSTFFDIFRPKLDIFRHFSTFFDKTRPISTVDYALENVEVADGGVTISVGLVCLLSPSVGNCVSYVSCVSEWLVIQLRISN